MYFCLFRMAGPRFLSVETMINSGLFLRICKVRCWSGVKFDFL
jgi:hypothetical protein